MVSYEYETKCIVVMCIDLIWVQTHCSSLSVDFGKVLPLFIFLCFAGDLSQRFGRADRVLLKYIGSRLLFVCLFV